jgi:predicted dienelactone hydrolase
MRSTSPRRLAMTILVPVAMLAVCAAVADAASEARLPQLRGRQNRPTRQGGGARGRRADTARESVEKQQLAGLAIAIWRPSGSAPAPLVVFSHGFRGCNTQSTFLTQALADAGYLVVAPNHQDAICGGSGFAQAEEDLKNPSAWTEATYKDRADDVRKLLDALRTDQKWNAVVDWSQVALAGHSLGGYTVLGLSGAWSSWKLSSPSIKATLALSPYCQPFPANGHLGAIGIPVMYQGGTRDLGITPAVKKPGGCFSETSSPAYFVEFTGAGHLAWSDLRDEQHELITAYALAFLDKHVRGMPQANPSRTRPGVSDLKVK